MSEGINFAPYLVLLALCCSLAFVSGWKAGRDHAGVKELEGKEVDEVLSALAPETLSTVDNYIRAGQKIAAIKALRAQTGSGLRLAKLAVDRRAAMIRII